MKDKKAEHMGGKSGKARGHMGKKQAGFGAKLGKGRMGKAGIEGPHKK